MLSVEASRWQRSATYEREEELKKNPGGGGGSGGGAVC